MRPCSARADTPEVTQRPDATQPDGVNVAKFWNVAYNDSVDPDQPTAALADLYVPVLPADQLNSADQVNSADAATFDVTGIPRPAILLVHGGGWIAGDKWMLGAYCEDLCRLGFVILNINYRLAPQAKFPAQADDVREGLRYLTQNAERLCIDVSRIGMFGYSAGGHLSALIGVLGDEPIETVAPATTWPTDDPRWEQLPRVAAVCAGGPPCDFRVMPLDNETFTYFLNGPRRDFPDLYEAASPTAHASAGDPPFQIIHGETDMIVPLQTSERFAEALRTAGASVDLTVIPNQGHMVTFMHPTTRKRVLEFFQRTLLK
ncbi:alpha/beta hydrolase [Neorhodopirellula pilleata]|uniref:alpha/beta hydrolase n=1 Tax=Neorhodopirellula pilleata TaxID=2714738 RepID=UPI001E61AD12|nr:alpha/beta hydrolase [Neorhodopirellula pilleata]